MRTQARSYEQETSPDYWADDSQESTDYSDFEAGDDCPGSDPDEDTPDMDLRNW